MSSSQWCNRYSIFFFTADLFRYMFGASLTGSSLNSFVAHLIVCRTPNVPLHLSLTGSPRFCALGVLVLYGNFQLAHRLVLLAQCTTPATCLLHDLHVLLHPTFCIRFASFLLFSCVPSRASEVIRFSVAVRRCRFPADTESYRCSSPS